LIGCFFITLLRHLASDHRDHPTHSVGVGALAATAGAPALTDDALLVLVENTIGVGFLVVVRLILLYVLVVVSGTLVVGATPTVISAEPPPCCPSMPMTM
jgi:hypothetical protein